MATILSYINNFKKGIDKRKALCYYIDKGDGIMSKMFTIIKASKVLGVTTYTLRNWAKSGKIKAVKIPDNTQHSQWFIPEEEMTRLTRGESNNDNKG